MNEDELLDALESVLGKQLQAVAFVPEAECLMLCFEEGKTFYISGDNLKIDLEAAN